MDDVIRYENLAGDLRRICQKLDVTFQWAELRMLKSEGRPKHPLKDYYSERSIEIVQRLFRYELEKFGYAAPA